MDNKDCQQDENEVWLPTPQLQEEREEHLTTGTKISPEFKSEPFSFQKNTFEKGLALSSVEVPLLEFEVSKRNHSDLRHKQEKRSLSTTRERVTKRHRPEEAAQEETNTLSHHSNMSTSQTVEDDDNYTRPLDSDEATDSENDDKSDDLQNPTTSDIHSDQESSCVDTHETFFTTTDGPRPCYRYDMEEEEMETESNMWKLRANRVQQILLSLGKKYSTFSISKRFGIQYNVGFGPKQNFSVDSLTTSVLLEIAKFALAMNSSQEDFIMEILEYNFDFGQWSEDQRKRFTSKIMNRVRWLKNCEDAVKLSKEAFESPDTVSSVNMANQSVGSVKPEFSCMSRAPECDVAPTCSSDPQAETKEHKVDLYPFCKDIGLKLNVISSQENKKLDINKLTDAAMTEVTNFAEKLCGTFDQICLDILRHNFDLDQPNGDSDLAKTIVTRIPIIVEYRNLSNLRGYNHFKCTWVDFSYLVMDYLECPNIDTCRAASSQAPTTDQNVGSSTDSNHQNELNLWIWKLRSNQIKQILSVPHVEHCPLYSYSRCKKSGIDFNVGSGVKQNFDPSKYLTHGIMVEISTFATALLSAQKEFITEILEYNFDLNFKNELCRIVFAQEVQASCRAYTRTTKSRFLKMPFELPDSRVMNESTYPKAKYCPKCFQDRNSELCQDESDLDHLRHPHPHCLTDTVSSASNCLAQKPEKDLSAAFQAAEQTIMDSYPFCKKIGLSLCVDRDKPKVKLDTSTLTRGVMKEIVHFAKRLCGTTNKIANDVLGHNFNFGNLQSQNVNLMELFSRVLGRQYNKGLTWFNDIFVVFPCPYRDSTDVIKPTVICTAEQNEKRETTRKRILALQKQKEEAIKLSKYTGAVRARECKQSGANHPISKQIVLDLDLENPTSTDIHSESEPSCLGNHQPFLTAPDGSSSLPIVDSNVNPSCVSQPDERGLFGTEEKTEIQQNVSYKFDMEEEEMETESNMWKLRANRVQQILFSLDEYCSFKSSKHFGLEYNVGFGPKKNFNVYSSSNSMLLEIAKFAVAMNSSQEDFIMEILEYNFDFGHWSEDQRESFTSKLMSRVRWLKNCKDAVKLSKEACESPDTVSSVNMANQSMGSVKSEFSCMSRAPECDVAPTCSSDPQAETKEHKGDLYPFCKDIGLKLNVISSQEHKKLDINKLTNGAMTEVTNFAEKLCGTFDQICLDILRHNFDLDSDLARTILTQIPVIMEHNRLANCVSTYNNNYRIQDISATAMDCQKKINIDGLNLSRSKEMEIKKTVKDLLMMKNCQNNSNLDTCSTGFSQAPITSQNVGSSTDTEIDNETNLLFWKLRQSQIRQILAVPHGEHCPFYSYSRCKKLGIDFNVGSGKKQNFDPAKFLTNGIMLEMTTLSGALVSAQKDFITEILEYNFELNFNNEACRSVFAQCVFDRVRAHCLKCKKKGVMNMPFELPDPSSVDQSTYPKAKYCPKCYQDRNSNLYHNASGPVNELHHHPHSMSDTVFAETNCSAQKPTEEAFHAAEEKIMNSNPRCKKIGLSLCVDKDKPKRKLDLRVLTRGVMREIGFFAKRLCGTKKKNINDVLEHNFNFGILQSQNFNFAVLFCQTVGLKFHRGPTWFNSVFVDFSWLYRATADIVKQTEICTAEQNDQKGATKTQTLTLHTKNEERSHKDLLVMKTNCQINPNLDTCSTGFSQAPIKSRTVGSSTHIEQDNELVLFSWPFRDSTDVESEVCTAGQNENKETTKTQKEEAALLPDCSGAAKGKTRKMTDAEIFPLCSKIGLDLDVASKSEKKEKLDLNLLTIAVVIEINKYLLRKLNHYYPGSLYDILDYNFDVSSQNYRRWEFSIAAASGVRVLAKNYRYNLHRANEVFKLPFVFEKKASDGSGQERLNQKTGKSHQKKNTVQQLTSDSAVSHAHFLDVKMYKELWMSKGMASPKHAGTIMQMTKSPGRSVCDSPLQEDLQIKDEDEDDSHYGVVKPEPVTSPEADMTTKAAQQLKFCSDVSHACLVDVQTKAEVWFHEEDIKSETYPETIKQRTGSPVSGVCDGPLQENMQIKEDSYCVAVKPEPVTEEISEPKGSIGYNLLTICPPSESNIKTEPETEEAQYYSLTGPQVSEGYSILAVCPNTESSVKTESDTEDVKYEIPPESVGSQAFCSITTHQDTDSTSVKMEQDNVPIVSSHL